MSIDPQRPLPAGARWLEVEIDRRRFLVVVGSAAAYAALRPYAAWAKKLAADDPSLQQWRLPDQAPRDVYELTRALIGAAVLAPSYWNSQPWRFEVEIPSIRLVADKRRSLPITDPTQRNMMISLGAALENLLVAARAYGLRPTVQLFPHDGAGDVVADVSWAAGQEPRDRALFLAIPTRRTNRRSFDGRGIFPQNRAQLTAQVPEGFHLRWVDDGEKIGTLADLCRDSIRERVRDDAAQAERYSWMRFGDQDARRHGDGVTVDALEFGGLTHWMAGRYFNPKSWMQRFGVRSAAKQAHKAVRTSGAVVLLTADRAGERPWLTGGQVYQRIALKATQLGIAHQPISAPIELASYRNQVLDVFGARGEAPLMLVRLGHASRPEPSTRRAVMQVASFRNS